MDLCCAVNFVAAHDVNGAITIKCSGKFGVDKVFDPARIAPHR